MQASNNEMTIETMGFMTLWSVSAGLLVYNYCEITYFRLNESTDGIEREKKTGKRIIRFVLKIKKRLTKDS